MLNDAFMTAGFATLPAPQVKALSLNVHVKQKFQQRESLEMQQTAGQTLTVLMAHRIDGKFPPKTLTRPRGHKSCRVCTSAGSGCYGKR